MYLSCYRWCHDHGRQEAAPWASGKDAKWDVEQMRRKASWYSKLSISRTWGGKIRNTLNSNKKGQYQNIGIIVVWTRISLYTVELLDLLWLAHNFLVGLGASNKFRCISKPSCSRLTAASMHARIGEADLVVICDSTFSCHRANTAHCITCGFRMI